MSAARWLVCLVLAPFAWTLLAASAPAGQRAAWRPLRGTSTFLSSPASMAHSWLPTASLALGDLIGEVSAVDSGKAECSTTPTEKRCSTSKRLQRCSTNKGGSFCSTKDPAGEVCSAFQKKGGCSAFENGQCTTKQQGICSAIEESKCSATGQGKCSADANGFCSVSKGTGGTCTSLDGLGSCSVVTPGGLGCSTLNPGPPPGIDPPGPGNTCQG